MTIKYTDGSNYEAPTAREGYALSEGMVTIQQWQDAQSSYQVIHVALSDVDTVIERLQEAAKAVHERNARRTHFAKLRAVVKEGKKIEAIKLTRTLTGLGLRDAKDLVEALMP